MNISEIPENQVPEEEDVKNTTLYPAVFLPSL
jgi:hypothetical protein